MLLSDLLKVLGPVTVDTYFFLAKFIEPLGVAFYGPIKASLVLIVVLIARLYNLFMMICVLDVNIARKLICLAYNGTSGDWSTSSRARLIYNN